MAGFDPIVFDLDGTLVDSGADIAAAIRRCLASLGLPPLEDAEIIGYVGDGVRQLLERSLARFGRTEVDEAVARFKDDYRAHCLEATRPYPGVARLLAELAGRRLAVVTNKPADFARQILDGLGLGRHIRALVGGDESALKPSPEPVRLALERLGAAPAGGLMVGDQRNDVLAGRAAGLRTCGVGWGFDRGRSFEQAAPDHRCSSLAELRALLGV